MRHPIFSSMIALRGLQASSSFHIISRSKSVSQGFKQKIEQQTILQMSSGQRRRSSIKKVDFSGLTDEFATSLASDLNLDKFAKKSADGQPLELDKLTQQETRKLLADFVKSHPVAERQVARLVLQYLGINKSVFSSPRVSSVNSDDTDLNQSIPLTHSTSDIMPNLSPVSWLSEDSWASMTHDDKVGFMEHLMGGKFSSEHINASIRSRYYPTAESFKHIIIPFGTEIDRVVLGNGPRRVLVLVGIHGNESCGVEAMKLMLQRKALFTGDANVQAQDLDINDNWKQPIDVLFEELTMEILIGNPKAVERNTRFLKRNLNRLFDIHDLCDDSSAEEEGYTYELQRAKLIAESIREADFILDIHSTSADVGSFALPSSMDLSEELAECLPVKYVIESLVHMTLDGGTTLDCALLHAVPGICVECGQHSHPDIVSRAAAVISSFLQMMAGDGLQLCQEKKDKPLVMICESAERVQHGFEWLNQFPEFSFVQEFTPVFRTTERGDVLAPEGGAYIVMPTSVPVIGEEALFWASAK